METADIGDIPVKALKALCAARKLDTSGCTEKAELVALLQSSVAGWGALPGADGKRAHGDVGSDEEQGASQPRAKLQKPGRECPYLDTLDRTMLDFDFEKLCSVSLVNLNVYGCLVCGKYFAGRSVGSHAVTHALEANHYVFMHLGNAKIYCLPDDYEIVDSSLDDIKYQLGPTFARPALVGRAGQTQAGRALDGADYLPGFVGLNNLKMTDGVNVVVHALMRVVPLRTFLLDASNYEPWCDSLVLKRLGELTRKIWNPQNYKSHVSPHEFVQAISVASEKKFSPGTPTDPADFLAWLMTSLGRELSRAASKARKKPGASASERRLPRQSVVQQAFQGQVKLNTELLSAKQAGVGSMSENEGLTEAHSNFMFLSLDLPPKPLYKNDQDKLVIPQVAIFDLLSKFDGESTEEVRGGAVRTFRLEAPLPPYLVLHFKRFKTNQFFVEKNPTIVNFPVKNLELKDYVDGATAGMETKYDLVANVVHEGTDAASGNYIVHLLDRSTEEWYKLQDLHVEPLLAQQVALAETYLQVYELQQSK